MQATGQEDAFGDLLSCPVCFNQFEESGQLDPRSLLCGHSICHVEGML